jgi:hypothetical protein
MTGMIKYVFFISLIILVVFYILVTLLLKDFAGKYFATNLIFGYVIIFINFILIAVSLRRINKSNGIVFDGVLRLLLSGFLIFLWIKFMFLNIFGLFSGIILFTIVLPVTSIIYVKRSLP